MLKKLLILGLTRWKVFWFPVHKENEEGDNYTQYRRQNEVHFKGRGHLIPSLLLLKPTAD